MNNKMLAMLFLCLFLGFINCIGRECTWEKNEIDLNWYSSSFKPGTCVTCPDNCQSCKPVDATGKKLQCINCLPGYYMDLNYVCNSCEEDCQSCVGPTIDQCYQPKDGEFYNQTSKKFENCAVPHCGYCSKDGKTCNGCISGYYNVYDGNNNIVGCGICEIENCLYCYADYDWNYMPMETYYSNNSHTGPNKEGDISEVVKKPKSVSCSYCDFPYQWNYEDRACQKCQIQNCASCGSVFKSDGTSYFGCSWCESGYILLENNTCISGNIANCASYYLGECSYCNNGYSLQNNVCVECKSLDPHCSYCYQDYYNTDNVNSLVCGSCDTGYFQNEYKICEKCPDGCYSCYGYANYTYNDDYTISSQSFVVQCYSSSFTCQPYEQLDYNTNTCFNITIPGCLYAYSNNECSTCIDGYYFNEHSKLCDKCHPSCTTCNGPNDFDCLSCAVNKYTYYNASILKNNQIYYYDTMEKNIMEDHAMEEQSTTEVIEESHAPPTNPNYDHPERLLQLYDDMVHDFVPPYNNQYDYFNWKYRSGIQCLTSCPTTLLNVHQKPVNTILDRNTYSCYGNYTNETEIPYVVEESIKITTDLFLLQDMASNIANQLNSARLTFWDLECNGIAKNIYDSHVGDTSLCKCFDGYAGMHCEYSASFIDALTNKSIILANSINQTQVTSTNSSTFYLNAINSYFSLNIAVDPENITSVSSNLKKVVDFIDINKADSYFYAVAASIQQNYFINVYKEKIPFIYDYEDYPTPNSLNNINQQLFRSVLTNIRSILKKNNNNLNFYRQKTPQMEVYTDTCPMDSLVIFDDPYNYDGNSMSYIYVSTQSELKFDDSYKNKRLYLATISQTLANTALIIDFVATPLLLVESNNLEGSYSGHLSISSNFEKNLIEGLSCGILNEESMRMESEFCDTEVYGRTLYCECKKEGVMGGYISKYWLNSSHLSELALILNLIIIFLLFTE